MGTVYRATSPTGRKVALKIPRALDDQAKIALADEARMGKRLKHPAIVETIDFFEHKGKSVLVTEYVEGANLWQLRERVGALPAHAVAAVGLEVASALEMIHGAVDDDGRPLHMVHRDVSPGNVVIDNEGQARLIDLGIARSPERKQDATKKGLVKGTFRYLAPEILEGGQHTQSTDLWALGLTLWEAALGRYAVVGKTTQTMRAVLDGSVTTLHTGERVEPELKAALLSLVAPFERRLKNALVTKTLFHRLVREQPGGRDVLALVVRAYLSGAPVDGLALDATEQIERNVSGGLATMPPTEEGAATEAAPLPDVTRPLPTRKRPLPDVTRPEDLPKRRR